MIIGDRLKTLRETKNLSQGDYRNANGSSSLLYLPSRKRTYGSVCSDS
jgi:hypothetical protein